MQRHIVKRASTAVTCHLQTCNGRQFHQSPALCSSSTVPLRPEATSNVATVRSSLGVMSKTHYSTSSTQSVLETAISARLPTLRPVNYVSSSDKFSPRFSTVKKTPPGKDGDPLDIILALEGVTKRFDHGRSLFSNVTIGFYNGAKIGVLGKNGAGKSSLLRIIAGVDKNFDGQVKITAGRKVGYLAQEPKIDDSKTVWENVVDGVRDIKALLDEYDQVNESFGDPDADVDALMERQAKLQAELDERNGWDVMRQVEVAMEMLRCPPKDAKSASLSGGERRRVALARLLLSRPDIMLLDEPTNHLDNGSVAWLEQFLQHYPGLVIAITHDRYFLDNVAGYILEIESGRFLPFKGNYGQWMEARQRRFIQEESEAKALDRVLAKELDWMKKRAHGRQAKGKARVQRVEELLDQRANMRKINIESGSLVIPQGPRLGRKVVTIEGLGLAFDPSKGPGGVFTKEEVEERTKKGLPTQWLFRNVNLSIGGGQIVGIVGPNGIGKTTLLKVIQGLIKPTEGTVTIGESVVFGYNAQTRTSLKDEATVWEEITQGEDFVRLDDAKTLPARQYVAQFNFSGSEQNKLIKNLSGGERNRVHLAKSLKNGANVILLDEPTNDLDVDTLRSLEEAMNSFEGAAFIVSHDRWFLDRVCTEILGFDQGKMNLNDKEPVMTGFMYRGNYTDFIGFMKERTGKDYMVSGNTKAFKNVGALNYD